MGLAYYIIDTETTGLSNTTHEVVQFSIIRCADRVQISRDIKSEHPETASPQALAVTNKTKSDIIKGHTKENVVELIDNFFQEDGLTTKHRVIVGHNIFRFDKGFLFALWGKCGKKFPAENWLDTLDMMREYTKIKNMGKVKVNLRASMEILKIGGIQRFHVGSTDAQNNFLLWQKLMEENIDYLSMIKREDHVDKEEVPAFPEF